MTALSAGSHSLVWLLQHVLAEDLKAADIEVGVARADDGGAFRCGGGGGAHTSSAWRKEVLIVLVPGCCCGSRD